MISGMGRKSQGINTNDALKHASLGIDTAKKHNARQQASKDSRLNRGLNVNTDGGGLRGRTLKFPSSSASSNPFSLLSPTGAGGSIGSATSQFEQINKFAEDSTGPAQYAERAGEAIEDVDRQFAGQEKARQVRMSRMGLDPSQTASVTGGRQDAIAQAAARAGAMQSARRQAEAQQEQSKQSAFQSIASLMGQDKQMAHQSAMASQRQAASLQSQMLGMQSNMMRSSSSFRS